MVTPVVKSDLHNRKLTSPLTNSYSSLIIQVSRLAPKQTTPHVYAHIEALPNKSKVQSVDWMSNWHKYVSKRRKERVNVPTNRMFSANSKWKAPFSQGFTNLYPVII